MEPIAIDATSGTIRVGEVVRDCRFSDQAIQGWVFDGSRVVTEGTWVGRPWSSDRVADYDTRVRRHDRWRRWPLSLLNRHAKPPASLTVVVSGIRDAGVEPIRLTSTA